MKVIRPTPMVRTAAEVIEPVKNLVAVFGAAAIQIAVGDFTTAITPTTDVDLALVERGVLESTVDQVVCVLRTAKLDPSDVDHERGFTWVSDTVKIQLVRGFVPFPKGQAKGLPTQPGIEDFFDARQAIAFEDSPEIVRFWCADPASLIGLKQRAFGRTRDAGVPVVRDFVDVYLLMRFNADEIVELWPALNISVRQHVMKAIKLLMDDESEAVSAGSLEEMLKLGLADDALSAAADMRRTASQLLERLR